MICLDIDGVVADPFVELNYHLDERGYADLVDVENWTTHKWQENYPHVNAEHIEEILRDPLFAKNSKPYEDAWYFLNHYSNYHQITLLTARPKVLESATWNWVYDWELPVDNIIFEKDKLSVLMEMQPIVFVDDYPRTIEKALDAGINAKLMVRNYNKDSSISERIGNLWELNI